MTELTERRKADRTVMAAYAADLAREHGLTAEVHPEQDGTRRTSVDLAGPHGLRLTVKFDGSSPHTEPDTYVLSWHGVDEGQRLAPGKFGSVNPVHGHKATDVARGFRELARLLAWRFECIADGSAFVAGPAK
jgi:hypothetical protein